MSWLIILGMLMASANAFTAGYHFRRKETMGAAFHGGIAIALSIVVPLVCT